MVDAVVSYAVQNLGDFLIQEVSLRQSLRENVLWLRNELSFMQSFLRAAEHMQAADHLVQQLVYEITCVANDVVAILETYSLDIAKDGDAGFVDRLKACACICPNEAKFRYIGTEIQSLKQRVMDISRKRDTYGITVPINNNAGEGPSNYRPNDSSASAFRTLRRAESYADSDQLFVGFQEVLQRLLSELLKEESCRTVLSIYGMGGLGKTTLARNLYNSPSVLTNFHARAWICVSQHYSTPDLLRSIIKSIQGCNQDMLKLLKEMTERDLERHLRDLLKERKYLVVVDDVWHRDAWESLKRALPDNSRGSRVILTTRNEDVAERVIDVKGFSHKLRFLNEEESWGLFCKKVRQESMIGTSDTFSPAMQELATGMVEKCKGLPLAIVVLGGLLSHRKGVAEWKRVKAHIWKHIKNDTIEITHILSLSYEDLSFELKQCFLYLGIFQEDQEIDTEKLMYMWLAEGFIPQRDEPVEDIAEIFLHELIRRSLIQVSEIYFGKFFKCRIHDLLRDLAIQEAMKVHLFDIYDPTVNSVMPFRHRHAIHRLTQRYLSLDLSNLKVRSISFFDKEFKHWDNIRNFMSFCKMFQHLYVLDLEGTNFTESELPDAIGNLVHLKFLGLSNTNAFKLPSSIGKLKRLQTLEALLTDGRQSTLPPQVAELTNLRHLHVRYDIPLQVDKLTNLQTLKYVRCDQWKDTDAASLVNLRELGMESIFEHYCLKSIGSLKSLTTLFLSCGYNAFFPPLEFLSSCENLHRLWLSGGTRKVAELNNLPKSITMLYLQLLNLTEDPMPILGMFPNLKHLELEDNSNKGKNFRCKDISCKGNSFSQLENLRLINLINLESWHVDASAMPLIKGLTISRCKKLKNIPERMKHVPVYDMEYAIPMDLWGAGGYYRYPLKYS